MNEHFHTYMHTHAQQGYPRCVCVSFMREFATGAPRFIVHTYTHRIVRICVYMGDIKAIDAKHFATGLRIAPTTQTHKCAHMCVCLGSCRPS